MRRRGGAHPVRRQRAAARHDVRCGAPRRRAACRREPRREVCRRARCPPRDVCGCVPDCVSCRDGVPCAICNGSRLGDNMACSRTAGATAETHGGVVACGDGYYSDGHTCTACDRVFGDTCAMCTAEECLVCRGNTVLDSGACVEAASCARGDGTRCVACAPGCVPFNARRASRRATASRTRTVCVSGVRLGWSPTGSAGRASRRGRAVSRAWGQPEVRRRVICGRCRRLPASGAHRPDTQRAMQTAPSARGTRHSARRATPRRGCS